MSARDIAEAITAGGFSTSREQIVLRAPIKAIGLHTVPVHLHPEVECAVTVNVARSPEEAERQAKGEKIILVQDASMQDLGLDVGAALAEASGEEG